MGIFLPQSLAAAPKAVGAISEVEGEAFAELNNQRRVLSVRASVFLSELIETGRQSRLVARLARRTILRLGAETRIKIDMFVVQAGGELILSRGALLLDIPKARLPLFKVQSLYALIAVRGTRFFAGDLDKAFSVFVVNGTVSVTAGGKSVRLRAGEGTDIARPGDPPGPVKKWGAAKIAKAMALVS